MSSMFKVTDTEFEIRRTALDAALDLSRRSDRCDAVDLVADAKIIEDYLRGKESMQETGADTQAEAA